MARRRDGEQGASGTVKARDLLGGVLGRRTGDGVDIGKPTGPDDAQEIVISADAANRLLGVGTGPSVRPQPERRVQVQVSGLSILRYNRLTAERERRGLSVEQLAAASGLPVSLVARLEASEDVPDALREQLAAGLDSSVDRVFPITAPEPTGPRDGEVRALPTPTRAEIGAAAEARQATIAAEIESAASAEQAGRLERLRRRLADADYRLSRVR